MSDEDTTQETAANEAEEQQPAEAETDAQETEDKDEKWDPEKAKRLIGNLREDKRKQQERAAAAEKKAASVDDLTRERDNLSLTTLRYEVALDLGLPKEIASRLQGADRDEMVADAEKLLELLAPARPASRRPREALRAGLHPDKEPEETDVKKLGARMFER